MSANGQPIYFATLANLEIVNVTHAPVSWILPEGTRNGTSTDDNMDGNGSDEVLYGLDSEGLLRGQGGNDTLFGGDGNDSLAGLEGSDHLIGRSGRDTVSYIFDFDNGGTAG